MADYFRIRSMMEKQALDALLILGNRNCAYLASGVGDEPWFNEPHGLAAWMILLAPPDKSFVLGGGEFSEIDMPIERIQGDQNRDARLQIVADRITSAKLDRSRIGVDMDYMPNSDMAKLSGLLPNVRFETADSLMARARASKTPMQKSSGSRSPSGLRRRATRKSRSTSSPAHHSTSYAISGRRQ